MYGGRRCPVCGEPVGVYERVVAFDDDGQRVTSLAREPELSTGIPTALVHESCAPAYHPNAH